MKVPTAREFFFPSRALDPAAQQDLETRFFRSLRLPNGTYKTTYADRMPDVDAALCGALPTDRTIRLLDVGVSSGVTTLELLQAMERRGIAREAVAVDISVNASLVAVPGAELLCDPQGRVLQIATRLGTKGRPHDPAGSLPRTVLDQAFRVAEWLVGGPAGARRGRPVQLIIPRLLRRPDVQVVEHDLTQPNPAWVGAFDVVRAANVLNHEYFDEATLRTMLSHLRSYLRPGGVLTVCRTHDESATNHATVMRLGADGALEPELRIGRGSEVESLATALPTATETAGRR